MVGVFSTWDLSGRFRLIFSLLVFVFDSAFNKSSTTLSGLVFHLLIKENKNVYILKLIE